MLWVFPLTSIKQIVSVYADKGYNAKSIQEYLRNRNIQDCTPFRKNNNTEHDDVDQNNYNKARFVAERFFALIAVIIISVISMMKDYLTENRSKK